MRATWLFTFPFAAGTLFAATKVPDPKPELDVPASFQNLKASQPAGVPDREWWKAFGDPLLSDLITRAVIANSNVRQAMARLAEANATRRVSRSALAPTLDAGVAATRLRGGVSQGVIKVPSTAAGQNAGSFVAPFETSVVSGGLTMRWEADVFGGLRKADQATQADARAAQEDLNDVRRIVAAEVARNYIELRAAEDRIAVTRANAASEKDLLDLTAARTKAGLASGLDVERETAQLATVRAQLPGLDAQRVAAIYRIGVLLGEPPDREFSRLAERSTELAVPSIPAAIPGDVLRNRPDLRRADTRISAAFLRAGSARADLYPKFVITGLGGRQSTGFDGLTLGGGNYFSVGPAITLPIFNYGRIRAHIAQQDALLQLALREYEGDVLTAFEETENALVGRDRALQRQGELQTALSAARTSVALAQELFVKGLGDFLAVLDAQRQQFQTERDLAAAQADVLRGSVAIFRALGF